MEKQHQHWVLKKVAHDLARAVKQFWHSAETVLNGEDSSSCKKNCNSDLVGSMSIDSNETSKAKDGESNMVLVIYLDLFFNGLYFWSI